MKPLILISVKAKCSPLLTLDSNAGSRKSVPRQHDWQLYRYIPTRRCQGSVEGESSLCPFSIYLQIMLLIWSHRIMNWPRTWGKKLSYHLRKDQNLPVSLFLLNVWGCVREVMTLFEIVIFDLFKFTVLQYIFCCIEYKFNTYFC